MRFLELQWTKLQNVSGSGRLERAVTRFDSASVFKWLNDISHSSFPGLNFSFCLMRGGSDFGNQSCIVLPHGTGINWPRDVRLYNGVLLGLKPEPMSSHS